MKKVIILLLVLCSFSVAHSQDFVSELQRLTLEKDSLQRQIIRLQDSISSLNTAHNTAITNLNSQIAQTYNRPFDELIRFSTKQSVERDLLLIGNNETAKKRLQNLQIYFAAEQLLSERFNEQRVNAAQNQLASIEQSELVKNLADRLRMYNLLNDGLRTTINRIIDIDRRFVANDDYTQDLKLRDILAELAWYFRNFRFNFTDYPYLRDIVLEIMTLKQRDANADIRHLLEKL